MSLKTAIRAQFGCPTGTIGHVVGWILSSRPSNRERNRWTVGLIAPRRGETILEIGCGPGEALRLCAERMGGGRVVGIDHSEVMVGQARRRLAAEIAAGRIAVELGGLEKLDAAAGVFDRAFSINVMHHLPDLDDAFRRIAACLAPGGIVATTHQPRSGPVTRDAALAMAERIRAAMTQAGFQDIAEHELPLRPVPAICVTGRKPTEGTPR